MTFICTEFEQFTKTLSRQNALTMAASFGLEENPLA